TGLSGVTIRPVGTRPSVPNHYNPDPEKAEEFAEQAGLIRPLSRSTNIANRSAIPVPGPEPVEIAGLMSRRREDMALERARWPPWSEPEPAADRHLRRRSGRVRTSRSAVECAADQVARP